MMRHRMTRIATVTLAAASLLLVAGCGPVNAGGPAADRFEKFASELAGVEDVIVGGSNNLPFVGSVSGEVRAEDDLDDAQLRVLADELTTYTSEHSGSTISFHLQLLRGSDAVPVGDTPADNDDIFDAFGELRAIESVVSIQLSSVDNVVTVTSANSVIGVFDTLLAATSARDMSYGETSVSDVDGFLAVEGRGDRPDAAIAVYLAVSSQFDVIKARLSGTSASVQLRTETDVDAARRLAERLWAPNDTSGLSISGGIVTRSGGGDFYTVDPIISSIRDLPGLAAIRAESDGLLVYVDSFEAIAALEATIAAQPDTTSLRYVTYRSTEGVIPSFWLSGSGTERGTFTATVAALLKSDYLIAVSTREEGLTLDVEVAAYDSARMAEFAAQLKAATPPGTAVQLEADDSGPAFGIRFTASDQLSVRDVDSFRSTAADEFVAAWNAAP